MEKDYVICRLQVGHRHEQVADGGQRRAEHRFPALLKEIPPEKKGRPSVGEYETVFLQTVPFLFHIGPGDLKQKRDGILHKD